MGGNCDELGGYTMNRTKILLDKSSVRQKSYQKKKFVDIKETGHTTDWINICLKKIGQNHGHYVLEPSLFNTHIKKKSSYTYSCMVFVISDLIDMTVYNSR